jgi:hypothetical protein
MNQNKTAFKLKKFENTRNTSTLMFEVKGARAFWDDSLSIPGTDRRGGFRCPLGTENGGQITDRFGRNCGVGIVRRVGKLFGELGDRINVGDGTRREERRVRPKPPAGSTGRTRGVLAGSSSPTPETDNPFGVSSVAASATKPIDKPIIPPVSNRKETVDAFGVTSSLYAEGGIRKHIIGSIEEGRPSARYGRAATPELLDEAEQALNDVTLELPGDAPGDSTKRVQALLETLKQSSLSADSPESADRILIKSRIVKDLYNSKIFREQAAVYLSEDYTPNPLYYSELQHVKMDYELALMGEETHQSKLRKIESLRQQAISDLANNVPSANRTARQMAEEPRSAELLDERKVIIGFEKLDMLTSMREDIMSKNSERLGWGIMLEGETATELAPGIPKILNTNTLGDPGIGNIGAMRVATLQFVMRRYTSEQTEGLELIRANLIESLKDEKLNELGEYEERNARNVHEQLQAVTLVIKERIVLKDTADANPTGYHPDGVPILSKDEMTSNPRLEEAVTDEWEFLAGRLRTILEPSPDDTQREIDLRNEDIITNQEILRRRIADYAFDMNRVEVGSYQWKESQLRYHAALMAYDAVLSEPTVDIPDVLPDEIDSQLKEIALQEFDKRQEYLGEWMKTQYPKDKTPWTEIRVGDLSNAVLGDDDDVIETWVRGAYEIEMTGLDGREYRTEVTEIQYGDNLDEQHFESDDEIFVYVGISVLDEDTGEWKKIGSSERYLSPSTREIYSGTMNITDTKYRGAGIASIYNGNSWTWGKGAGFESVGVMAVDDGSYVWGRVGYVDEDISEEPFVVELAKYRRGIPSIIKTEEQAVSVQRLIKRGAGSHMDWIFALENGSAEGTREEMAVRKIELGNWFKQRAPFSSGEMSLTDDDMFALDPRIRVRRAKGKTKPKVPLLRKD